MIAEMLGEEKALQQQRHALEQRHEVETAKCEETLSRRRERYSAALQK